MKKLQGCITVCVWGKKREIINITWQTREQERLEEKNDDEWVGEL